MHKIKHGMEPDYLAELFPESVGYNSRCNLRNSNDITLGTVLPPKSPKVLLCTIYHIWME